MALVEYVVFHPWRALTVLVVGILIGLAGFYAYQVNAAFGAVAVEQFDPDEAREAIEGAPDADPIEELQSPPTTYFDYFDEPNYDLDAELARIDDQM